MSNGMSDYLTDPQDVALSPLAFLADYPNIVLLIENYETVMYTILGVVFIGIVLGWSKKSVVFYDYDDMALCFGVFATPVAMWFVVYYLALSSPIGNAVVVGVPTVLVFSGVLYKTWISGVRFSLPIMLVAKLFLGFFYVLAIWQLLSPSGSSRDGRKSSRAMAGFFLMVFTPIIASLVENKTGVFFNAKSVSGRGIKGVSQIRKGLE